MKPINHILCHLLPTLIVLALTSCSKSDSPAPIQDEVQLSLTLSVGEVSGDGTRAPSDGEYNEGDALENYIDIFKPGNVRVVLFTPDNKFLGELKDFVIAPIYTGDISKRYVLTAGTKLDISSGKFKVLVLANWPDYPEGDLTLEKVWNQEFSNYPAMPTTDNPIPLFGIKEISLKKTIEPDIPVNIGTIHLLRAVAKIEVVLNDPYEENFYKFDYLKLSHYNTEGLCAPYGIDSQNKYVTDKWATDYVGYTSIPEGVGTGKDLDFTPIGNNRFVVYVPEYKNTGNDAVPSVIKLKFENEVFPQPHEIQIKHNGEVLDFHRNVWYRVTINKKKDESTFDVTVDVLPYKVVKLEPIFGINSSDDNEFENTDDKSDPENPKNSTEN